MKWFIRVCRNSSGLHLKQRKFSQTIKHLCTSYSDHSELHDSSWQGGNRIWPPASCDAHLNTMNKSQDRGCWREICLYYNGLGGEIEPPLLMHLTVAAQERERSAEENVSRHHRFQRQADSLTDAHFAPLPLGRRLLQRRPSSPQPEETRGGVKGWGWK